jgi:hypothetical protein
MRLLFYTTGPDRRMQWLYRRSAKLRPVKTEFCPDLHSFETSLRYGAGEMTLAVILADSREELQRVTTLRPLLIDVLTILILPDSARGTIARGHALRPRYLTDTQCNFRDLYEIIGKMLQKYSQIWETHNSYRGGGKQCSRT